jgi:hypothetical protein
MSEGKEPKEALAGEAEEEGKGFTVKDRRRFDADGGERAGGASEPAGPARTEEDKARGLPEIDFSTFVLSLSTSALVHLGEVSRPDGKQQKDLALAKQTIDIVAMLKNKTVGNLTEEESRLLEELLFDLRLKYVAATRASS